MKNLIGISGKLNSGKDTVAGYIRQLYPEYELKSFAHKVKLIATLLTGIPVEKFSDMEFKKTVLPEEWHRIIRSNQYDHIIFQEPLTVREMLQKIGTNCLRNNLHKDVWINALFADYRASTAMAAPAQSQWIITDVRFPNEAKAILDRGGILIRMLRTVDNPNATHESETALDDWTNWSHVIDNRDMTLEQLQEKVKQIISVYE